MESRKDRKLLAVVFTDIIGYSALTQEDERLALEFVNRYRQIVTECTDKHNGTVIQYYGDGSLTVHESALDAVNCTIEIQAAFAEEPQIPVRIGIHLGEVVMTDGNIYGNTVNLASRMHNLGKAQAILITGVVAKEVQNHPEIKTELIGPMYVKNIKEKIAVYAICNDDLVVPSHQEVYAKSKGRKKSAVIITTIIVLALLGSIVADFFPDKTSELTKQRILVLPFTNETGDTSLEDFSVFAPMYIHQLMNDVAEIKLVNLEGLLPNDEFQKFSLYPYSQLKAITNTQNILEGEFGLNPDGTIKLSCRLVNSSDGSSIEQFEEQNIDPQNQTAGLIAISGKIIGFVISSPYKPLSTPNGDAFRAYLEALRVWNLNGFKDSRKFLRRSIGYDSTFLEPYHLLMDSYYNVGQFDTTDSIFNEVNRIFRIENQNVRQKNETYYYTALYNRDFKAAYKYLGNIYAEDKKNLFNNTTYAGFELYYLNAPEKAIKTLKKIPFKKLGYDLPNNIYRLTIGVHAYCAIQNYKKASEISEYLPSKGMTRLQHELRIRASVGTRDTTAVEHQLKVVKLTLSAMDYANTLFWTAQQFELTNDTVSAIQYWNRCLLAFTAQKMFYSKHVETLIALKHYADGLENAKRLYAKSPENPYYASILGRVHSYMGRQDSALYYLDKLHSLPRKNNFGRTAYQEALLLTKSGDTDGALIKLQSAIDDGFIFYEDDMEFDPRLKPLFKLPEFQRIIRPVGQ